MIAVRRFREGKKIISLILILNLVVYFFAPITAAAEEVTTTEEINNEVVEPVTEPPTEPTVENSGPTENSEPVEEPVVPAGDVNIDTGDTQGTIFVENEVNTNQTEADLSSPDINSSSTAEQSNPDTTGEENSTTTENIFGIEQSTTTATTTDGLFNVDVSTTTPTTTDLITVTDTPTPSSTVEVINNNEGVVDTQGDLTVNSGDNSANENGNVNIETGDVNAGAAVSDFVNYNDTIVSDCGTATTSPTGTTTDCLTEIEVANNNQATTTVGVGLDGNSGENKALENDGNTQIDTGDVNAVVDVSNLVNTNITGEGEFVAVDVYGNVSGDLDAATMTGSNTSGGSGSPSILDSETVIDNSMSVTNNNFAEVVNDVEIMANSGGNYIAGNGGDADITTGDVQAVANISNIVNTNIYGQDWKFIAVNIFGGWQGDIILPNYELEVGNATAYANSIEVTAQNTASSTNNLDVTASSGDNLVSGNAGDININTGDSIAFSKIVNEINTNILGNNWFLIKINIFGQWNGKIFGLPDTAGYIDTGDGIIIYSNPNGELDDLLVSFENGYQFQQGLDVEINNSANVTNNVKVTATSGDNEVIDNGGDVNIDTGNVFATANIANYVNTNLIGDGWDFTLINVFGKWTGNLEFGRPDLWVKETINIARNPAGVGEIVSYQFDFGNNGDGSATGVRIYDDFDEVILEIRDSASGQSADNSVTWDIGELEPGSVQSFSYSTIVSDEMPEGTYEVSNTVSISGNEEDRDPGNNSSGGSFYAFRPAPENNGGGVSMAGTTQRPMSISQMVPASLSIGKTHNATGPVAIGDTVSYTLVIRNTGHFSAYEVIVDDVLTDSRGREVAVNSWELDEVLAGEEIIIEYDIEILENAISGTYTNEAFVEGWDDRRGQWVSALARSEIVVNGVEFVAEQNEEPEDVAENSQELSDNSAVSGVATVQIRREVGTNNSETELNSDENGAILGTATEEIFPTDSGEGGNSINIWLILVIIIVAFLVAVTRFNIFGKLY